MKKVIRITEGDLKLIIKRVISETERGDVDLFLRRRLKPILDKISSGDIEPRKFKTETYYREGIIFSIVNKLYKPRMTEWGLSEFQYLLKVVGEFLDDYFENNLPN